MQKHIKDRPILFSAPMVRAILDGRKTQTRRAINPQPAIDNMGNFCWKGLNFGQDSKGPLINAIASPIPSSKTKRVRCPYGNPGDRLWVRETFHHDPDLDEYFYKADCDLDVKWKPSIHMPRIASRLLLQITNVRVERLNEISEEDAAAEGLKALTKDGGITIKYGIPDSDGFPGVDDIGWPWHEWNVSPAHAYRKLWESINGRGSWVLNPWVWVIEFMPNHD